MCAKIHDFSAFEAFTSLLPLFHAAPDYPRLPPTTPGYPRHSRKLARLAFFNSPDARFARPVFCFFVFQPAIRTLFIAKALHELRSYFQYLRRFSLLLPPPHSPYPHTHAYTYTSSCFIVFLRASSNIYKIFETRVVRTYNTYVRFF
jgi:hypothetical protein